MTVLPATLVATIICVLGAWLAWTWAPVLVEGTALADLDTVLRFGAVLAFLTVAQKVAQRLFDRDH